MNKKFVKLVKGDKVAVLSPSFAEPGRFPDVHKFGLERLETVFGLVPVEYPTTSKLGASAEERSTDLISAFENDPEKGLRELEWTSSEPVTPIGREVIPSALEDMIKNGVKVYFVDKETYKKVQNSPDHGELIVKSLTPAVL